MFVDGIATSVVGIAMLGKTATFLVGTTLVAGRTYLSVVGTTMIVGRTAMIISLLFSMSSSYVTLLACSSILNKLNRYLFVAFLASDSVRLNANKKSAENRIK